MLVLLVPLHLLGFEPSASVIIAPFAIAGLGFALATLRVILRQIGGVKLWLCVLAALVLACCSVVPYTLQFPSAEVYHEAIVAGYCFSMAGIWLAVSAIVDRRASLGRLVLMSLCFGLAVGSRPTLVLVALLLIPVYFSLRETRGRELLVALSLPLCGCLLLLAAYNQARYGSPLDVGTKYQINNGGAHSPYAALGYVPPGIWAYLLTPPRLETLFPYLFLMWPQFTDPLHMTPTYIQATERTGGVIAMSPILLFLTTLPWMWRQRPTLLGPLGLPLLVMACAAIGIAFFLAYYFFSVTERYEVDFATLLLFGALAAWLVLSTHTRGARGRLIRVSGGILAIWSCVTGLAITYQELWANPQIQHDLVNLGSPLSRAITIVAGRPVLALVEGNSISRQNETVFSLNTNVTSTWLGPGQQAELTIVSPDRRRTLLAGNMFAGPALRPGAALEASISRPKARGLTFRIPAGREVLIPVSLEAGINRFALRPIATAANILNVSAAGPEPSQRALLVITNLHLVGN